MGATENTSSNKLHYKAIDKEAYAPSKERFNVYFVRQVMNITRVYAYVLLSTLYNKFM